MQNSQNWPKGKCWVLSTQVVLSAWMLSKRIRILNFTQIVNFVVEATTKVSALPLEKCVMLCGKNHFEAKCTHTKEGQIAPMEEKGQMGPIAENVHIDVMYMK